VSGMADPDLLVNAAVSLASAVIYGYVGRLMWRRALPPGPQLASRLFGVWWAGLGLLSLLSGLLLVPTAFGTPPSLALVVTLLYVLVLVIVAAIWALLYYLLYVYTGTSRWLWPLSVFYALMAIALVYWVTWAHPIAVGAGNFALDIQYERKLAGWPATALGLLLSGPVLAAAVAYGSLWFKAQGPTERFRIGIVSSAFILWFGWSALSGVLRLSERYPGSLALTLVSRVFGLAAPILVLLAYRPPAALRRKYRLRSVDEAPE
jgi:hypothetical protein